MISSRALSPRLALILAACGITLGPFVLGVAVANTLAVEFISTEAITTNVTIAAIGSAIIWSTFTLWLHIPSSISQSLIGGMMGASWAGYSVHSIQLGGLYKVLFGLFLSPVLGLIVAFYLMRLVYYLAQWADPHINKWFNRMQILVALLMAISFGANDGQKIMAIITMGLVATGKSQSFAIQEWVIVLSALTIGFGTLVGGKRLIQTLGNKFYKIRPVEGFGAQTASAAIIFSAGIFGAPISGSQVVTSSILGAGSADRIQKSTLGHCQANIMGMAAHIAVFCFSCPADI